ncbi:MAG: PEGA domain-containing protein [Verrucomicrobiota bacterium]
MKTTSETPRLLVAATGFRKFILPVVFAIASQGLHAQDKKDKKEPPPPTCFIRIANTVAPGTGNVKVEVDGKDVYPPGYKFGAVTGGIGLPPGNHSVTISREGVKEGTSKVTLDKDQTVTLIPFAEKVPATDQEPAHFEVRIMRLKQKEVQEGRSASFISVSGQPELNVELRDPAGKWAKIFVKRLTIGEAPIRYPEGYAPVRVNGKDMESIPIGDTGNYVIVLYDDAEGVLHSVCFRDFKFLSAD